ncbi:MAG: D-Ala-D-Ala carboxypeptidase family metallohydrolase [Elainellaceae cyanobacterium]
MLKRFRVYRIFIIGILIGLFFAVIVSDKAADFPIPTWLDIVEQRVLVLIFSGILGGVLYTIVVDGVVELPRFKEDETGFEAGLLGDLLLGIAGAFIIEFLTSARQPEEEVSYITYAAKGIIGGYGSKALMNLALNKFLSRFEAVKEEKEAAEREVGQLKQQLLEGRHLFDRLNNHINEGVSDSELIELKQSIQQAPPQTREQVFQIAKEFRSMSSRVDVLRTRTQRTIPVFEALVNSDPGNHGYHAQLAFAYKDAAQPNPNQALSHLDQAISLRDYQDKALTWKYELNRAIVRIQIGFDETGHFRSDAIAREKIIQDLLTITDAHSLDTILQNARDNHIPTPIVEWMISNQTWLSQRDDTKELFASIQDLLDDARLTPSQPPKESPVETKLPPIDPALSQPTNGASRQPETPPVSPLDDSGTLSKDSGTPASTPTDLPETDTDGAVDVRNTDSDTTPAFTKDEIRSILHTEVIDTIPITDGSSDLRRALQSGLIRLKFLEHSGDIDALQSAWGRFKRSMHQSAPHLIGPGSVQLFLEALDQAEKSSEPIDESEVEGEIDIEKKASGNGGVQSPDQAERDETQLGENAHGKPEPTQAQLDTQPEEKYSPRDRWCGVLPNVPTTGAIATAWGAGIGFTDVLASHQMARQDLSRIQKLLNRFSRASRKYEIPAAILAAIASRESRCGNALDIHGYGDYGNAFGIMQIDKRHHTPAGIGGDPASQAHIDQAAEIIADNLRRVQARHPDWEDAYILKGAVAAYNFGVSNVRTKDGIDDGTTGDDYGSDVIARAQFYAPYFDEIEGRDATNGDRPSHQTLTLTDRADKSKNHWIQAVQETWLKKSTDRADKLPSNQKVRCHPGKIYEVESFQEAEKGHYWVKLAYGGGEWYIFDSRVTLDGNHWDTTWENDHDETAELSNESPVSDVVVDTSNKKPVGAGLKREMSFNTLITPHITYGELAKYQEARRFKHNYQCVTAYELCLFLEKCREHFGGHPLVITSGYRPPAINSSIGARKSEHLYDHPEKGAVDFYIKGISIHDVQGWCDKHYPYSVGYGAKKGFVHIGYRPGKPRVRWNY